MKVCERTFSEDFKSFVATLLDPRHVYQSSGSCEDPPFKSQKVYILIQNIVAEGIMLVSCQLIFSSILNTIQRHILVDKLVNIKVPIQPIIHLIINYLTERTQFVKLYPTCRSHKICSKVQLLFFSFTLKSEGFYHQEMHPCVHVSLTRTLVPAPRCPDLTNKLKVNTIQSSISTCNSLLLSQLMNQSKWKACNDKGYWLIKMYTIQPIHAATRPLFIRHIYIYRSCVHTL